MASAPEVHDKAGLQFSTLPEAVPLYIQEKEVLPYQQSTIPSPPPRRWGSFPQRGRLLLTALVVILAAAIIGTVAGLLIHKIRRRVPNFSKKIPYPKSEFSKRSSTSPGSLTIPSPNSVTPSSPSTPTSTSICRGTICPSMLAIAVDTTPSAPAGSNLFFFLGQDKLIWYRRGDGITWFSDWKNLGTSGVNWNFQSQPAAVSFSSGQTNIWVVDTDDRMRALSLKNGVWDNTWLDLVGNFTTPNDFMFISVWHSRCIRPGKGWIAFAHELNLTSSVYTDWLSLHGYLASAPIVDMR
jgi:hypothetical protein